MGVEGLDGFVGKAGVKIWVVVIGMVGFWAFFVVLDIISLVIHMFMHFLWLSLNIELHWSRYEVLTTVV